MHPVHGTHLVRTTGIAAQLRHHPPARWLEAHLQAFQAVEPVNPLDLDRPTFPPEQNMEPTPHAAPTPSVMAVILMFGIRAICFVIPAAIGRALRYLLAGR
jgi:hypothetical protein